MLSDSIKKKHRALKMGISERDTYLEKTFEPVIQPLKEISQKLSKTPTVDSLVIMPANSKEVVKKEKQEEYINSDINKSIEVDSDNEDKASTEEDDEEEELQSTPPSNLTLLGKDISSQGELSRKYVLKMLHGSLANRKHHVYGARLEKSGLMIGNSPLELDESDNLIIKGKTYPGTVGLFELVFKKLPMKYTAADLRSFKLIVSATNAHKKNYLSDAPLHRNTSQKFKNIITKLFPNVQSGSGLRFKNANKTNIIYYNNINKLVDRLRLLYEAQQVGHTGVANEIVSLTEELRQRGYIE